MAINVGDYVHFKIDVLSLSYAGICVSICGEVIGVNWDWRFRVSTVHLSLVNKADLGVVVRTFAGWRWIDES